MILIVGITILCPKAFSTTVLDYTTKGLFPHQIVGVPASELFKDTGKWNLGNVIEAKIISKWGGTLTYRRNRYEVDLDLNNARQNEEGHFYNDDYYVYTIEIEFYNTPSITSFSLTTGGNNIFSNQSDCFPSMNVKSGDCDDIKCTYSIDSDNPIQTKDVTNTANGQQIQFDKLDISNLSNGPHTMSFVAHSANDLNYGDEKYVTFIVDKVPPQISTYPVVTADTSITLSGTATDTVSGLNDQPYDYTLNGADVGWNQNNQYTWCNLTPNTYYDVKMGARDKGLNEAWTNAQHVCTRAQIPSLIVNDTGTDYINIGTSDSNSVNTEYLFSISSDNGKSGYLDANGNITSSPVWITLPSKSLKVFGLTNNTRYYISAKARNSENIETYNSNTIDHYTLANPTEINVTPGQTKMDLTWNAVSGAIGYQISIDGNAQPEVTSNYFTHSGLQPEEQHTYCVRVRNQSGYGPWSAPRVAKTLLNHPDNPPALNFKPTNKSMTISWDSVARATLYNLEIYDANGYKINSFSTSDLSYLQDNLHSVTTYSYRIQAQNAGGTSDWSPKYTETTYPDPPVTPVGFAGKESYKYIDLTWNKADRATSYIIEITNPDGTTKDVTLSGDNTSYRHDGLTEDNKYKYRIMASNIGGDSQWSDYIQITTLPIPPKTPTNVTALGETGAVTLTWDAMLYATSYDIEIDGDAANIIHNGNSTVYKQTNLQDNSKHQYRIMAINRGGNSDWTKSATVYTLPGAQAGGEPMISINAAAVATRNSVNIYWEPVSNNAEYEIEVDGQLHDNGKSTSFIHDGLEADTSHTYRIRVKNDANGERWYAVLTLSTLPNPPQAPGNLNAVPSYGSIALKWDGVDNANGYDVEVDGKIISNDMNTTYLSDGLDAGTAHTYRVRARNLGGNTAWTPLITVNTLNPAYSINCTAGKTINFDMTVSQLQTFSGKTFCIEYNPDEIEVVDLCGLTQAPDVNLSATEPTAIPDANMYVMGSLSNGKKALQYTIYQPVTSGEVYSGIVNRIIFRAKKDCKTQIFYTIK